MAKRTPRKIFIPMSKGMHEALALQMHISLAVLKNQPDVDAFDALAGMINMVSLATDGDDRFRDEMLQIKSGTAMMNQISDKVSNAIKLNQFDIACLTAAINTVDQMISRISVGDLHIANQTLIQMKGEPHG